VTPTGVGNRSNKRWWDTQQQHPAFMAVLLVPLAAFTGGL
jgi:hypothetical protein